VRDREGEEHHRRRDGHHEGNDSGRNDRGRLRALAGVRDLAKMFSFVRGTPERVMDEVLVPWSARWLLAFHHAHDRAWGRARLHGERPTGLPVSRNQRSAVSKGARRPLAVMPPSSADVRLVRVRFLTSKGARTPHETSRDYCNHGRAPRGCRAALSSLRHQQTPNIDPWQTTTLKVTFTKPGMYPYLCTLPGHAAAGMKGVLKVT
jgi:Copper binding proteins, plastocyanin/azurin family